MDGDRQRVVAAWAVPALGLPGVIAMTLLVPGWETWPTIGAYLLAVGTAAAAGALPTPSRDTDGWF